MPIVSIYFYIAALTLLFSFHNIIVKKTIILRRFTVWQIQLLAAASAAFLEMIVAAYYFSSYCWLFYFVTAVYLEQNTKFQKLAYIRKEQKQAAKFSSCLLLLYELKIK